MQATSAQQPTVIVVTNARDERRAQSRYNRWSNQNQSNSAAAATMLLVYGGMDMALGLGWNANTGISTTFQFQFSWFIGVLAGALFSSLLVTHVPKIAFYGLGGILSLVDGIIFVSAPYQYVPIIAARYVGGVGIGLITVPFIIHSTEIAARSYRGICSSMEQYGLALGIAIQMIYASQWTPFTDFPANQVHGIFGIVFSAIALGSVAICIESPIFYLRQNQEEKARIVQRRLIREFVPSEYSESALNEAKMYVQEGNSYSLGAEIGGSLMPFIKLLFFRCFVAFTFSAPLSLALQVSAAEAQDYAYSWPAIVAGCLRLLATLIASFVLDTVGRKFVSILGLLAMAALMLTMGGIFATPSYITDWYYMDTVCRVSMAFQFFAGLYVCASSTYLGEAFTMRVKPFFIALIVAIEQVVHIVVILTFPYTTNGLYLYFVIVGIIMVLGIVFFGILMPETRNTTLREAGARFRRVHDIMAY